MEHEYEEEEYEYEYEEAQPGHVIAIDPNHLVAPLPRPLSPNKFGARGARLVNGSSSFFIPPVRSEAT